MTGILQQINSSSSKFQRGWLFKITSKEQLTMTKFQLQSSLLRLTPPQLLQLKISLERRGRKGKNIPIKKLICLTRGRKNYVTFSKRKFFTSSSYPCTCRKREIGSCSDGPAHRTSALSRAIAAPKCVLKITTERQPLGKRQSRF